MTFRIVAAERASGCSREMVLDPTGSPVWIYESTIARRISRSRLGRTGSIKALSPGPVGQTFSWHRRGPLSRALEPRQKVGPNERIEIAVENAVHVSDLDTRAVVLDQPVGLQYVGPD